MTTIHKIAYIKSDFPAKFGIPRQSNMVKSLRSTIVFEPEYQVPNALRGLETFTHIWLIWGFSEAEQAAWRPTVRPPKLGGNTRMGVFATRSPYRPNSLGLSSVKIDSIERHPTLGMVIQVLGADLMDGTPIYDIKPYLLYTDCHPDAVGGFVSEPLVPTLDVVFLNTCSDALPAEKMGALKEILAYDPRPSYHSDPERIFGMKYAGFEVKFKVEGSLLTVIYIGEDY